MTCLFETPEIWLGFKEPHSLASKPFRGIQYFFYIPKNSFSYIEWYRNCHPVLVANNMLLRSGYRFRLLDW